MSTSTPNHQADIIHRALQASGAESPDFAKSLLSMKISSEDEARVNALAEKARQGDLSVAERTELDEYEQVGSVLGSFQSFARMALKNATQS